MQKYKIKFYVLELNKFNLIESDNIRKSAMSIYSYMIKLNSKKNEEYNKAGVDHLKDETKFCISMSEFLKLYNRSHDKISIRTLKNRIDLLEELQLIAIDKTAKTNTYSFCRYIPVNEEVNEKVNEEKVAETVENTDIEVIESEHKDLNTKTPIMIYDNINTSIESVENKLNLNDEEKVDSFAVIYDDVVEVCKENRIKSSYHFFQICEGLRNAIEKGNGITKKFYRNYILKTVLNYKAKLQKLRKGYTKSIKINMSNKDTFNNYPQRSYNYNELEKKLLGWQC